MATRQSTRAKPKTPRKKPEQGTISSRASLEVVRADGHIVKCAHDDAGARELANEARFLTMMADTPFVPRLISVSDSELKLEDIGEVRLDSVDQIIVYDEEAFRRQCICLLYELRQRGIRHGDLTAANILVRDDIPVIIDFHESRLASEGGKDKRAEPDAFHLWNSVAQLLPDGSRVVRRWMAIREDLGWTWEGLEGKSLLDVGTCEGDFCAMARAEGAEATGLENSPAAEIAQERWGAWGCEFHRINIVEQPSWGFDIVLMLSLWPYIVQERGRSEAEALLASVVDQCGVLYFETQLMGDGPGPDFLVSDEDVVQMLGQFGEAKSLVTLPVMGRDAQRTVWKIVK